MNKLFLIAILFLSLALTAKAQVIGINTENPDQSSILDITNTSLNNKGVLIPQMTTIQKLGIKNPAHSLLVYDTDLNCISQNKGNETDHDWECLMLYNQSFFYMPSINISTAKLGDFDVDLFKLYQEQFASPMYKNPSAPKQVPQFTNPKSLYYYVTYSDESLIRINNISEEGIMNYTILKKANFDDYINIVFVVK